MIEKLNTLKELIKAQKATEKELLDNMAKTKLRIKSVQDKLYDYQEWELHLSEILRLAKIHFPRLHGQPEGSLTPADYVELNKWVSRAKSVESLKSIVLSFRELSKYYPQDIKRNLYGLVQRIIIEGPYGYKKPSNN